MKLRRLTLSSSSSLSTLSCAACSAAADAKRASCCFMSCSRCLSLARRVSSRTWCAIECLSMAAPMHCCARMPFELTTTVGKLSATSDRRTACRHHWQDRPELMCQMSHSAHEQHDCHDICLISRQLEKAQSTCYPPLQIVAGRQQLPFLSALPCLHLPLLLPEQLKADPARHIPCLTV